jgi:hypothetical protein
MRLIYPREANLTASPLNANTSLPELSLLNPTTINATSVPGDMQTKEESSWFSRLLEKIPGYTWLRTKVGRFIFGPTYEMTPAQLDEYLHLEAEREEHEAELKVQKFMALHYPDWYWKKYIFSQEQGSEGRKRAVFIFALTNKSGFGRYWRRLKDGVNLNIEFEQMGVKMEGGNLVKMLLGIVEGQNETVVSEGTRMERRDIGGAEELELILPEEDLEVYSSAKEMVELTSIAGLRDPGSVRGDTVREVSWEEESIARAKYD